MKTNATLAHHHDDTVIIPALGQQLCLLGFDMEPQAMPMGTYFNAPTVDLDSYSRIIVCMSGKDSIASLLTLIEQGADMSRVELWHHRVDGASEDGLMDWAFNDSYMEQLAKAFNLPLYFSWLQGGIEGEMLKENSYSQPHIVETPNGIITLERDKSRTSPGTRRRFPSRVRA